MTLIGYARVSTEDQTPLPQSQAMKSAGCAEIHEEQASGRPMLARVLERIGKGDTLIAVRIDRLAPIRSDGGIRFASSDPQWVCACRRHRRIVYASTMGAQAPGIGRAHVVVMWNVTPRAEVLRMGIYCFTSIACTKPRSFCIKTRHHILWQLVTKERHVEQNLLD